ncbi:MAG: hypothetical protein R2708_27380 [Vicinamibacterales bacterium]
MGHYDVSPNGALAYLRRQGEVQLRRLVWVDREGGQTPAVAEARNYSRVSLSADGSRIAATIERDGNTDVWVGSSGSGGFSRLTRDPTIETMPALTPDGAAVAFVPSATCPACSCATRRARARLNA